MNKKLILVTSPPACGKTFISKALAERLQHVVYLDKDTLIPLSKQIFKAAGEPYNRSSDFFEENIRDYEYECIVEIALEALTYDDIVLINAPFSREIRNMDYINDLKLKLKEKSATLVVVWVETSPDIVHERMIERNSDRDTWKLEHWDEYLATCNFAIPKSLDDPKIKDDLLIFRNNNPEEYEQSMQACIAVLEETMKQYVSRNQSIMFQKETDIMEKEAWRIEKEQMVKDYHERNKTAVKGGVVFTGSSLMEMFPIEEFVKEAGIKTPAIYNRGVGGYRIRDLQPILNECVFELEPAKIFINIGTNDLSDGNVSIEEIMQQYDHLLTTIETGLPQARIYMMAYYPINYEAAAESMKPCLRIRNNEKINEANRQVSLLAGRHGHQYIDVNAPLKDEQGRLKAEYTIEGMHIKPEGYRTIFEDVMRYVME